jgi:hypothetical protein
MAKNECFSSNNQINQACLMNTDKNKSDNHDMSSPGRRYVHGYRSLANIQPY